MRKIPPLLLSPYMYMPPPLPSAAAACPPVTVKPFTTVGYELLLPDDDDGFMSIDKTCVALPSRVPLPGNIRFTASRVSFLDMSPERMERYFSL